MSSCADFFFTFCRKAWSASATSVSSPTEDDVLRSNANAKGAQSAQEAALRAGIVQTARDMERLGINQGTSGNVSARCGEGLLITPSGVPANSA